MVETADIQDGGSRRSTLEASQGARGAAGLWSDLERLRAAFANADPQALVGWLYTGGSTGDAKLWAKTAKPLLAEAAMLVRVLGVGPADVILATVSPSHIYGLLYSVIVPILAGARVDRVTRYSPEAIRERMSASSATILVTTPAHLRILARLPWSGSTIRLVLSSGAPLRAEDATAFHESSGLWPLEVYGSTETGGVAVRIQADQNRLWTALPGVAWRVANDCIAVRSEYLGPDLPCDNEGYFVTANMVRVHEGRAGAQLELVGRRDRVVKVGGKRVALCDVEEKLRTLRGVTDALVLAQEEDSGRGQHILALAESSRPSHKRCCGNCATSFLHGPGPEPFAAPSASRRPPTARPTAKQSIACSPKLDGSLPLAGQAQPGAVVCPPAKRCRSAAPKHQSIDVSQASIGP